MGVDSPASPLYLFWVQLSLLARDCGQVSTCAKTIPSLSSKRTTGMVCMSASTLECLFEYMQLLVELGELLSFGTDLAHRMQDRGVVPPSK